MKPIISIFILVFAVLASGIAFFYIKRAEKKNKKADPDIARQTANELINLKDIRGKYGYTRDNHVLMYLKVEPVFIDLFSRREKREITRRLTAELSSEQKRFKFIAVSRPADVSLLTNEYAELRANSTDQVQKDLLRKEMLWLNTCAISGESMERQFYFIFWERYEDGCEQDLLKRCQDFASKLESCGSACEIMEEKGIARLGNLVNNPAYVQIEDSGFESAIPFIVS